MSDLLIITRIINLSLMRSSPCGIDLVENRITFNTRGAKGIRHVLVFYIRLVREGEFRVQESFVVKRVRMRVSFIVCESV